MIIEGTMLQLFEKSKHLRVWHLLLATATLLAIPPAEPGRQVRFFKRESVLKFRKQIFGKAEL